MVLDQVVFWWSFTMVQSKKTPQKQIQVVMHQFWQFLPSEMVLDSPRRSFVTRATLGQASFLEMSDRNERTSTFARLQEDIFVYINVYIYITCICMNTYLYIYNYLSNFPAVFNRTSKDPHTYAWFFQVAMLIDPRLECLQTSPGVSCLKTRKMTLRIKGDSRDPQ